MAAYQTFHQAYDEAILRIGWKQIQNGAAAFQEVELEIESVLVSELRSHKKARFIEVNNALMIQLTDDGKNAFIALAMERKQSADQYTEKSLMEALLLTS